MRHETQVGNRSKRKTYQLLSEIVELIINLDKLLNEVSFNISAFFKAVFYRGEGGGMNRRRGKSQSKEEIVWKRTQLTHLFDRYV